MSCALHVAYFSVCKSVRALCVFLGVLCVLCVCVILCVFVFVCVQACTIGGCQILMGRFYANSPLLVNPKSSFNVHASSPYRETCVGSSGQKCRGPFQAMSA